MKETAYSSFGEYQESRGATAITENGVRQFIAGKAGQDETFRKALLADPLATVEAEVGIKMPRGLTLTLHEETADELHLVLPAPVELTPKQMERVSGGWPPAEPGSTKADDALFDPDGGHDYD